MLDHSRPHRCRPVVRRYGKGEALSRCASAHAAAVKGLSGLKARRTTAVDDAYVDDDADNEVQWGYVRLDVVRAVVGSYGLWKDSPWYHEVDWSHISSVLDQSCRFHGPPSSLSAVLDRLAPLPDQLSLANQWGLASLVTEPITVTDTSLTNGGHRLAAMLRQGVEGVPAMLHRWDIGRTLRAGDAYRTSASGGRSPRQTEDAQRLPMPRAGT